MTPYLTVACIAGIVFVALGYLLVWAVCAAAADADDWAEEHLGIRRS